MEKIKKEIVKIKYLGNGIYEKTFNDKTKERHFDSNLKRTNPRVVKRVFKTINKSLFVYGMKKTLKIMESQGL